MIYILPDAVLGCRSQTRGLPAPAGDAGRALTQVGAQARLPERIPGISSLATKQPGRSYPVLVRVPE